MEKNLRRLSKAMEGSGVYWLWAGTPGKSSVMHSHGSLGYAKAFRSELAERYGIPESDMNIYKKIIVIDKVE
ncbi:MAG: hypothetical protein HY367_01040 [Candidatus Aenigmarchaeota archaeon]|nr:hypothetical protein [Candidatus Aenigmarchaeota archaeon]